MHTSTISVPLTVFLLLPPMAILIGMLMTMPEERVMDVINDFMYDSSWQVRLIKLVYVASFVLDVVNLLF